MPYQGQNSKYPKDRPTGYYSNNRLYVGAYGPNDYPTRVSRRMHEGFVLDRNYGLDTTDDDVNSSPYSSPYYINGRYNSDNLVAQRANSASVQGCIRLATYGDQLNDFSTNDIQTTLEMWQGKQIKFKIPYSGKVVGHTLTIRNTGACTGILSIYLSATDGGRPLSETSIDLRTISQDKFEHITLYTMTPVPQKANPRGELFVRMEIWDEVSCERGVNPFNTGKKIEIAATGKGNHEACVYRLGDKNIPVTEKYEYKLYPSRPLIGLIYNPWHSLPTNKDGEEKDGATVSLNGYRYDLFTIQNETETKLLIYDPAMKRVTVANDVDIDGRADHVSLIQFKNVIYYVDGWSPLQKFTIGQWQSSVVPQSTAEDDDQPVIAASNIFKHINRIVLNGFRYDPNLNQISMFDENGPLPEKFYRFYSPDNYPQETSINPITAILEFTTEQIAIFGKEFGTLFKDRGDLENEVPQQVPIFMDGIGVQSQGDVCNFKGTMYSFDPDEGLRYFTGSLWKKIAGANNADNLFDRVDMEKPRKLWGYANKLYFNYTDKVDNRPKCLIYDFGMNYQQYPVFQDVDLPFCDVRVHDDYDLIGIHPDFPCIMKLYAEDTWRRLDSPIVFERHTKFLSIPGGANDLWAKRAWAKIIANATRWWWISLNADKQYQVQFRGHDKWYRQPTWKTIDVQEPVETPFPFEDITEANAVYRFYISHIKIKGESVQMKVKCKTFRDQANLIGTGWDVQARQFK